MTRKKVAFGTWLDPWMREALHRVNAKTRVPIAIHVRQAIHNYLRDCCGVTENDVQLSAAEETI